MSYVLQAKIRERGGCFLMLITKPLGWPNAYYQASLKQHMGVLEVLMLIKSKLYLSRRLVGAHDL